MHASLLTAQPKVYNLSGKLLQKSIHPEQRHTLCKRPPATVLLAYQDQELAILKQLFHNDHHVLEAHSWQEVVSQASDHNPKLLLIDCKIVMSEFAEVNNTFNFSELDHRPPNVVFVSCDKKQTPGSDWQDIDIHNLDELNTVLQNILYVQEIAQQNEYLARELEQVVNAQDIIGDSPDMVNIMETANRIMHSDIPVLLLGEDGTGKELISRYIHFHGKYRHGRLVTLNCSITQESGYNQSDFSQLDNHLRLAKYGTLLLKEIEQLSLSAQSQVFQSLFCSDDSEFATGTYRIIATAHPAIKEAVTRQEFLPELFYRLSVVMMDVPPLNKREDDIPLLANRFLRKFSDDYNMPGISFDTLAIKKMKEYCWLGNVQEMENRIRRAVIMNQSGVIQCEDLGFPTSLVHQRKTLPEVINEVQKQYLDDTLSRTKGNVTKTARELGISRMALYDMIDRFNVKVEAYRREG